MDRPLDPYRGFARTSGSRVEVIANDGPVKYMSGCKLHDASKCTIGFMSRLAQFCGFVFALAISFWREERCFHLGVYVNCRGYDRMTILCF